MICDAIVMFIASNQSSRTRSPKPPIKPRSSAGHTPAGRHGLATHNIAMHCLGLTP